MEVFMGMIAQFGFNYVPNGWLACNGQLLPISQYSALFSLLGTYYGGDGVNTFALPDLQGRSAIGIGNGKGLSPYVIGQMGGSETTTLNMANMPAHNHQMTGSSNDLTAPSAAGNSLGSNARGGTNLYATGAANPVDLGSATSVAGGGQAFNHSDPFLAINYCICYEGIYPSRS